MTHYCAGIEATVRGRSTIYWFMGGRDGVETRRMVRRMIHEGIYESVDGKDMMKADFESVSIKGEMRM